MLEVCVCVGVGLAGDGGSEGGGSTASQSLSSSAVRSNLIPSPPTYNLAYDYISWEAFSNVSYYTRILPSVPKDCPTPMGTRGELDLSRAGKGHRRHSAILWGGSRQKNTGVLTHFTDRWTRQGVGYVQDQG